jgi:hypothetical protein
VVGKLQSQELSAVVSVSTQISQPDADPVAGEPILLYIFVADQRGPNMSSETVSLSCGGNDWGARLWIEIRSPNGDPQRWPWSWQQCHTADVQIGADRGLRAIAALSFDLTNNIPPATYFIRAALSEGAQLGQSSLTGDAFSDWQAITIVRAMSQGRSDATLLRRSEFKEFLNDIRGALAEVDDLLKSNPTSVAALARRSQLLSRSGRYSEAVQAMTASATALEAAYPDIQIGPEAVAVDIGEFTLASALNLSYPKLKQ